MVRYCSITKPGSVRRTSTGSVARISSLIDVALNFTDRVAVLVGAGDLALFPGDGDAVGGEDVLEVLGDYGHAVALGGGAHGLPPAFAKVNAVSCIARVCASPMKSVMRLR